MKEFVCDKCGCVDTIELAYPVGNPIPKDQLFCTACQGLPWHCIFVKKEYDPEKDFFVINRETGLGLG